MAASFVNISEGCAVAVVSCGTVHPEALIKDILESPDAVGSPVAEFASVQSFMWNIDNKYYTADIHLCALSQDSELLGSANFCEHIGALLIVCDGNQPSFEAVKGLKPFFDQCPAEVQILAFERFHDSEASVSRHDAQLWCIDHAFELVELYADADSGGDDDDENEREEFEEDVEGIKRIKQALQANRWPNLHMKGHQPLFGINALVPGSGNDSLSSNRDKPSDQEKPAKSCNGDSPQTTNGAEAASSESDGASAHQSAIESASLVLDEREALLQALGDEDPGGKPFEQLFEEMASMKRHAETLDHDERRSYAEKVAVAFWKAMGGDENEIEGLSD